MTPEAKDILQHGQFEITREVRPTQVEMARDIEKMLQKPDGTLLAEGGTGIGKSFAYLIPSLLAKGKRVVISTAKKTLQDQLINKDIPLLVEKMGLKGLQYGIYKGKSNYACWLLSKEVPTADREKFKKFISPSSRKEPADIATWKGKYPYWWSKVSAENCTKGARCPHFSKCMPQPKDYHLVVTNHHLLAIDLRVFPGTLFGQYNTLIIDEAHQAPDAFRSAFSNEVTFKGLGQTQTLLQNDDRLRSFLDDSGITTSNGMMERMDRVVKSFSALHRKAQRSGGSEIIDPDRVEAELDEFGEAAASLSGKLFLVGEELNNNTDDPPEEYSKDEVIGMQSRLARLEKRVRTLTEFVAAMPVTDGTPTEKNQVVVCDDKGLRIQPLNIGELVKGPLATIPHKTIISATLAMGNDFTFTKELFGLGEVTTTEKIYKSPFKMEEQAILYIPRHMPLPAHAGMPRERETWIKALSTEVAQLIGATRGDAFVLFSAKTDMNEVLEQLGPHFWNDTGLNLTSHDGDATATLNKYMETPNSVLFGLKSFWEGVDVPGDKLKLVIIPKLPFPNPKDPLIGALCEQAGTKSFNQVMVPHMFFDMKQGVGRLIRTQSDKGFVAILDPRVWTGTGNRTNHIRRMEKIASMPGNRRTRMGYGKQLLNVLGFTQITDDFTILQDWVKKFFKAN